MTRTTEASPIISGSRVRMATHPIVVADKSHDGAPTITLRREGAVIKEVQIRCSCGELIVLDCLYEGAAAAR